MKEGPIITCQICLVTFVSRNRLFRHLKGSHGYVGNHSEQSSTLEIGKARTAISEAIRAQYDNPHHNAYYRKQCKAGVMTIDEWEMAQLFFRRPLGISFRFNLYDQRNDSLRREFLRKLQKSDAQFDCSPYFDKTICQVAKRPLREWSESSQKLLSDAQDACALNRQELCSMIPPLLLDIQPNQTVIDLCAAPGSKTLQILDIMNSNNQKYSEENGKYENSASKNLLVANDSNRFRLLTVARRTRVFPERSCLVLSSSDGRFFPTLRKWGGYKLKFDRVLADVPCSGDGTLRKLSSKEWDQWNVKHHLNLHKLQLRLLIRALEIVKKGGRVVYSTCSLDPIENEAVVVSAIARLGGPSVYKIIPAPHDLSYSKNSTTLPISNIEPFPYSPGSKTWIVPHPKFRAGNPIVFENIFEVPKELRKKDLPASMFPPCTRMVSSWRINHQENNALINDSKKNPLPENSDNELETLKFYGDIMDDEAAKELERMMPNCCRILPQNLDSGGFFCAIIERVNPLYFAVCCPQKRNCSSSSCCTHHGRIYYPVKSESQFWDAIEKNTAKEGGITAEELNWKSTETFEKAQQWLRKHKAFIMNRSNRTTALPHHDTRLTAKTMSTTNRDILATPILDRLDQFDNQSHLLTKVSPHETERKRDALFKPMFKAPHPDLVTEFMDFFGLFSEIDEAKKLGVERFPVEDMVAMVGSGTATDVTENVFNTKSCLDLDKVCIQDSTSRKNNIKKCRFFQLVLASKEVRSLFMGGAKFSPIEVGQALCWVPIIDSFRNHNDDSTPSQLLSPEMMEETYQYSTSHPNDLKSTLSLNEITSENNKNFLDEPGIINSNSIDRNCNNSRAMRSGRYGLLDEPVELIGRCATRQIINLSRDDCLELLKNKALLLVLPLTGERLDKRSTIGNNLPQFKSRYQFSPGGVVAAYQYHITATGSKKTNHHIDKQHCSKIFLSCCYKLTHSSKRLELLTDPRLAENWLRLLLRQ